jgi:UDP-glucose:(heptosyl)LPS alpha-1,3-glucosyltransferase
MKTIALAIENSSRFAGGAESYTVSLAHSLIREGWEVHLFGESWDGEPEGAIFHPIKISHWQPRWMQMLRFALEHRRLTLSRGFDVVLGFGNTIHMNVYQSHGGVHLYSTMRKLHAEKSFVRRLANRFLIWFSLKQWIRHWIESAPFRMKPLPRIIAISQMIKEDMERFYGVNGRQIEVIYNGVDPARFHPGLRKLPRSPLGPGSKEAVFLFASYELKKKGIVPLMEATAILKERGEEAFRVMVAGADPDHRLARRLGRLGLTKTLLFLGRVRNMEECYAQSDVLVLPTFYDACSLVVFEAMACGIPCITTRTNGAAGIISDGVDGYILNHPPQPQDLANKMALLLDPERRSSMGHAAATTALQYTTQRNHEEILRILNAAVSSAKEANRE